VEIVATNLQLLSSNPNGGNPGGGSGYGAGTGSNQERRGETSYEKSPREAPAPTGDDGFADDIPF
jgi:single-stranded DNA-binding protein